jgi:hypothetical protein
MAMVEPAWRRLLDATPSALYVLCIAISPCVLACRLRFDELAPHDGGGDTANDVLAIDAAADAFACRPDIAQLTTGFDGESAAWRAQIDGAGVTVEESGGALSIQLAAPDAMARYAFYQARCYYDVRGHELSVEIVGVPSQILGIEMGLVIHNLGLPCRQTC